jgi:hypothetical protein
VKAALAQGANPMLVPGGGPRRVVLNNVLGKYKGIGTLEDNYVHMTETWIPNPVVGDMRITHEYVEWKDFGGFKFWTEDHSHMIDTNQNDNRQFRVSSARATIAVAPQTFAVPQEVTQANRPAVRVESTLAPGVWLLGGGSRNSVLVEFRDFVTVVEAPLNGLRGLIAAGANQVVTSGGQRRVLQPHYVRPAAAPDARFALAARRVARDVRPPAVRPRRKSAGDDGQPRSHEQFLKILGGKVPPDAHGPLVLPATTTSR